MSDTSIKKFIALVSQAINDEDNLAQLSKYDAVDALTNLFVCERCPVQAECKWKHRFDICRETFTDILKED